MSVHPHGNGWQVKYRDETGQQRGRSFTRKGDADHVDGEIKRRKALGQPLATLFLDGASQLTLAEFLKTGFRNHLAIRPRRTREQYQWAVDLHLQELLDEPLSALTVPRLMEHQTFLLEHKKNPRTPHTTRVVFTLLGKMLQVAIACGHLPAGNPAHSMTKVEDDPKPEIVPLNPIELEALISQQEGRGRAITVLAGHLGLSPIEVRLAPWTALNDDLTKLTIPAAKTKRQRKHTRVITIPLATGHELRAWRLQSGGRGGTPIIGEITKYALDQWGTRTLKPLITDVTSGRVNGSLNGSLYTLRHTHASLLHYCGYTPPAAAKRMGHSVAMHWRHYAHVVEALEGQPKFSDLDDLIAWARVQVDAPTDLRETR